LTVLLQLRTLTERYAQGHVGWGDPTTWNLAAEYEH
jgi:hypothetical protein